MAHAAARRHLVRRVGATVAVVGLLGACSSETGGRMRSVDDTGLAPSAIEEGWMAALPVAEATWDLLGAARSPELRYHAGPLGEADVLAVGGAWQPLGSGGRFSLPVEPGDWVLCYIPENDGGGATGARGCSVVALQDGSRIEVTWGEGGFGVAVD